MQRVPLKLEDHRGGLLTQASILGLTSDGTRHRPVHRGKWVLESIYGNPPPPPPPNVGTIKPTPPSEPKTSLRAKIEAHRNDANCSACHRKIDPLGLAFESYDAIGHWRTEEAVRDGAGENPKLDPSGELPDGRKFADAAELKKLMLDDLDKFAAAFTGKLATYALRRGMTFDDRKSLAAIAQQCKANDYALATLIESLVRAIFSRNADRQRRTGAPISMSNFLSQRWLLSRRHFLRGVGASVALPLLNAMTPLRRRRCRRQAAPQRVRLHSQRRQRHDLAGGQAGPRLRAFALAQPLEKHRDDFTVFSGLHHPNGLGQAHVCADTWLTGAKIDAQSARQYHNTVSCDQLMAEVTSRTPASLRSSCRSVPAPGSRTIPPRWPFRATACRCRPRTIRATSSIACSARSRGAWPPSARISTSAAACSTRCSTTPNR